MIWVNEEDHLQIISMQQGTDLGLVFRRLCNAVKAIEANKQMSFAHDERLGYLTSCPSNLGTTLRASVLVKLPNLG